MSFRGRLSHNFCISGRPGLVSVSLGVRALPLYLRGRPFLYVCQRSTLFCGDVSGRLPSAGQWAAARLGKHDGGGAEEVTGAVRRRVTAEPASPVRPAGPPSLDRAETHPAPPRLWVCVCLSVSDTVCLWLMDLPTSLSGSVSDRVSLRFTLQPCFQDSGLKLTHRPTAQVTPLSYLYLF